MAKPTKSENRYWENEQSETVEFGKSFFRTFDQSGKLQIGKVVNDKTTGEKLYIVKFVIDRKELLGSKEGLDFLLGTMDMWRNMHDSKED